MARRRKSEVKAPTKPPPKPTPVRKSNRQRLKKQSEEGEVNGDTVSENVNNSEDCKYPENDNSQEPTKKEIRVPKKSTRHKNLVEKEKSTTKSTSGGNDQDDLSTDSFQVEKSESVEKQISVSEQSTFNEVDWPEEIIEETIICEEMEVDTDVTESCSAVQEENVVLEQVLLVDDSNFERKDIIEYTVIQTEDSVAQFMTDSSDHNVENVTYLNDDCKSANSYETIEQSLSVLHMSDGTVPSQESKIVAVSDHNKINTTSTCNFDNKLNTNFCSKENTRSLRSASKSVKGVKTKKTNDQLISDNNIKKRTEASNKKVLVSSEGKEKSIKTKKNNSLTPLNVFETNNTQSSSLNSQNSLLIPQEDDNSSSMSDKAESSQNVSDTSTSDLLKDNKFPNNSSIDTKTNIATLATSKHSLLGSEEHSRDSELDTKVDSEDTKISSSSENSSDTLSLSNSCKNSDINSDNKNLFNQLNEFDKKTGFRSRSGSIDTTESDNSSNNAGVRRSSRIRTIGLMKPRSRGRGLVTKPPIDLAKVTAQQEREKFPINMSLNQDKIQNKDNMDNLSETSQSDKENNSNKTTVSQDVLTPLTSTNSNSSTAGYDSDSNKPVKVKSRWRRSSELEMSSNSESWSLNQANLNFPNSSVPGNLSGIVSNSINDTKLPPLPEATEYQDLAISSLQNSNIIDNNSDSIITALNSLINENAPPPTAETIGAKISLPMVLSTADREMEERLSQFEHLKENLYLTERYTSKETKRMLCDCFLTEEEFQRGELGCGEDCLNRMLMIECGPRCVVGDRCTNQRFQNCEYADCEVFRTEKKGFGLRAKTDRNPGEFIMEYVGEVVNPKDFRRRAKEYSKDKNRHYYFMALKSDQIIDATMKGNISRFINHSCDPNAETQKWTVNGELRIGFFNKKFVAAGEEITFDYHFQRYGKEAQKCYCEATNCRGWIGDNPEDNKETTEEYMDEAEDEDDTEDDAEEDKEDLSTLESKEKKPRKPIRRKKIEKKVSDHMEDEDLEEQIDKLCASGLKNRAHTLTLSRLMVRSREIQHRTRLLKVIQFGEQPCRRLFLDYHGLRLMWSYMMDVAGSATEEVQQFRLEILKTLSTLPIPNKTMLIDSKVLSVIEKWSKQLCYSPSVDSPEDDQSKVKPNKEEVVAADIDNSEKINLENVSYPVDMKKPSELDIKSEMKEEMIEHTLISESAANLLVDWSNLKEVFRIPKKERIEQMKEHEREADRGYKENVEKEGKESSYERHRSDKYSQRSELEKRLDRSRRGRDSPDFEHVRSKDKRGLEERPNLVAVPRMSKFERRQLFALKVAKEEEERQRRQQEDSWQQHEVQCLALGLDPYTTAAFDPQTGYPLFFNPQLAQWQAYPCIPEGTTAEPLGPHCATGPVYVGAPGTGSGVPGAAELVYPPGYRPAAAVVAATAATTVPLQNGPVTAVAAAAPIPAQQQAEPEVEPESLPPPPLDLPAKWKWARDKRGRLYYYHAKERIPQWLPPPPDHIAVQPDSSATSESSEDSSSSNDEDDEFEQQQQQLQQQQIVTADQQLTEPMELDKPETEAHSFMPETKKRRDGLVQERIISPRREEDRVDHKKYKEIKEKLRRQKERAKLKEHLEKIKKHRRSGKSKSYSKHSASKFQSITSDMSPTTERKIKDTFRINMANVMVHFLNPYRKGDCKQGRITNTEDFKHLARKLTHFVLAKELKHCKSVDELECNDNVKHKAKDFVRKYMSKFGAVYQKSTDED